MKYRISLKDAPKGVIRSSNGDQVIILEIPTLKGRKRYSLKDGDEIEVEDIVMEMALQNYQFPRLPVFSKSKKAKKFSNMFGVTKKTVGKKPFEKVTDNG